MKQIAREHFSLRKLKLKRSTASITIEWESSQSTETSDEVVGFSQSGNDYPHPDLVKELSSLTPQVVKVFSISKEDLVVVTGIAIAGAKENKACIITAEIQTDAGIPVGIATHRIKFEDNIYGFEEELYDRCNRIEEEAYEYIYNDKKSQLSIFGANEEQEQE